MDARQTVRQAGARPSMSNVCPAKHDCSAGSCLELAIPMCVHDVLCCAMLCCRRVLVRMLAWCFLVAVWWSSR
jgi:hypothetical protein